MRPKLIDIDLVQKLLADNKNYKQISLIVGKTPFQVEKFCHRNGMKLLDQRRKKRIDIDDTALRQMVSDDIQNRLIADHFGCSESCIERRLKELGLKKLRTGNKSGERHSGWKGGISYLRGYRYIYSPNHPNKTQKNLMAEHRLVMEQKLGRYLHQKEVVHHADGDRLNNHPDNLVVFGCNADHLREHLCGNLQHGKLISEGMAKSQKWRKNQKVSKEDAQQDSQNSDHHS